MGPRRTNLPDKCSNISVRKNSVYSNDDSVNFDNLSAYNSNSVGHNCLDILYTNADQFSNKRDDLCMAITNKEPDIILITEVLPKAHCHTISKAGLSLQGYTIFTNFDSDSSTHKTDGIRGVAIFVSRKLSASEVNFAQNNFKDHLWIKIHLKRSDVLIIGCVYRSPSGDITNSTTSICNLLRSINGYSHLLICGDFNYSGIDWDNLSLLPASPPIVQEFIDTIQDLYLFQHIMKPTRYRPGETPNILDLVFTNEQTMIDEIQYLPGLGCSDHVCLSFKFMCYAVQEPGNNRPKYNLRHADFETMREILSHVDWHDSLTPLSIHEAWEFFTVHFNDTLGQCIPLTRQYKNKNIYMSSEARRLKNRRNKLWKKYMTSKSVDDFHRYSVVRNELRTLTRTLRRDFERNLTFNIKSNPKAFWRYVNSRLKVHPTIGDLQCPDGSTAHLDKDKAELLNQYFTSVFTHENLSVIPSFTLDHAVPSLHTVKISPNTVHKKLLDINPNKSPGPEGWPLLTLKETAEQICTPLSILFNKSLESGILPQDWKSAQVTPIFKKGNRHSPNNYRPISLTSPVVRLFESIVKDEIYDHLNLHHLLCTVLYLGDYALLKC